MSGLRKRRRASLHPHRASLVQVGRPALAGGPTPRRMRQLARQVRALNRASRHVDYDDPEAEAAHYEIALAILDAVIDTPATTIAGLRVKAEALAWCYGGQPGPADTTADRLLASMLRDLLRPGAARVIVSLLGLASAALGMGDLAVCENICGTFG